MNENRIGRFIVDAVEVTGWQSLLPVMGNFVVVEARYRYDMRAIEYLAYSPLFEPWDEHCVAPEYEITVAQFPDRPAVIGVRRKDAPKPEAKPELDFRAIYAKLSSWLLTTTSRTESLPVRCG